MRKYILLGSIIIASLSCKENPSQPIQLEPYEKWKSYNLHDYTIDQSRWCFCYNGGETMRITIRSDTIAWVIRASDSSIVDLPLSRNYLTIDSLFAIIYNRSTDSLVITYKSTYGYPETLDINPQLHPVDGGVLFVTTNLQTP
jgi:hypothetical protein